MSIKICSLPFQTCNHRINIAFLQLGITSFKLFSPILLVPHKNWLFPLTQKKNLLKAMPYKENQLNWTVRTMTQIVDSQGTN